MAEDYVLIESPEELEKLAARLAKERVIAVDTEADSFYHYYDKICLVQIGYRGGIALVDPLKLPKKGLRPLAPIFENPDIRKIFHAADYDLYVLNRYDGFKVNNIFDTMISAQLMGYPAVGLAALVEKHFGVTLSKDQQRTDWSRRELKPVQIEYAASDVRYLVELTATLEKELRAKKRLEWAREEFVLLEQKKWPEREFDKTGFLKIKGAKKLQPRALAVLGELFLMRDKRARELDRPAFKVLGNGTLLELAQKPPKTYRALVGRKGITELVVRRLGQEIVDAVTRGLEGPEYTPAARKPSANPRRRLDRRGDMRLDRLKRWREKRAKELELDPGVFCPNVTLEEVAWANPQTPEKVAELKGVKQWWAGSFADEVIAVIATTDDGAKDAPSSRSRRRGRGTAKPAAS